MIMPPESDENPIPRLVFPEAPAGSLKHEPARLPPLNFDETPSMTSAPTPKVGPLDFGGSSPATPSKPSAPPAANSLDFGSVPAPRRPPSTAPVPSAPAPLDFGSVRAPRRAAVVPPSRTASAPAPLDFSSVPAPRRAVAVPPSRPVPASLDFSNVPAPAPAPVRTPASDRSPSTRSGASSTPSPSFTETWSPEEKRAIEHARADFSELFKRHEGTISNAIKQLLPFSLSQLEHYGRSALDAQANVVHAAAAITRDFRLLDATGLVSQALARVQAKSSFINRLRGNSKANFNDFRVRAEALRVQLGNFLPRIEAVRNDLRTEGERLPILLAALSSAASAVSAERDVAVGISVSNRRTVLTQAVQQTQVLAPQLEEMRRQAVEQLGTLENFLQTTLPALELAAAQGA